ncbi:MAG: DUF4397 domain-containing protein [Bacteroidetes bacterium]|nr:DUF4397 domain-containing protein [Bacteroidota bacterium]
MQKKASGLIWVSFLLIGFVAILTGCVKPNVSMNNSSAIPISYFNVMNLSCDQDTSAVFFGGSSYPLLFPPGSFTKDYLKLVSGNFGIQFKNATTDSILAQLSATTYDSAGFYTLILYNNKKDSSYQANVIVDDYSNISTDSVAYYRFFNLSPDLDSVDFYIDNLKIQSTRTPADNFVTSSFNRFQPVNQGHHSWSVTYSGGNTNISGCSFDGVLQGGHAYTFFIEELHQKPENIYSLQVLEESL